MPSWLGATGSEHSKLSAQKVECPVADPHSRGRGHRLAPTHWDWQPWSLVRGPTGTGCLPKTSQALSPGQGLRTPSQSPRKQNQPLPDQGSPVKGGLAPKPPALEA